MQTTTNPNTLTLLINQTFQVDPTRTKVLRAQFVREMQKRWRRIERDIRISIVDNDVFGIQPTPLMTFTPLPPKAFQFERTTEKVSKFMEWLRLQEDMEILEIIARPTIVRPGIEAAWSNVFIESAYQKGIRRGRSSLRAQGFAVPPVDAVPGGISAVINQPFHADRLGVLFTRTFDDLKTVADAVNGQARRELIEGLTTELTRGIAEGKNPRVIAQDVARAINGRVEKVGINRAKMIARTEIIRAHHLANIGEFRQAGVEGVVVQAEWLTAGDERVCPRCLEFERQSKIKPFTLDFVEGLIPLHVF